jgi:hypothetical protein
LQQTNDALNQRFVIDGKNHLLRIETTGKKIYAANSEKFCSNGFVSFVRSGNCNNYTF